MLKKGSMILEEFGSNRKAIINPEDLIEPIEGFPQTAKVLLLLGDLSSNVGVILTTS